MSGSSANAANVLIVEDHAMSRLALVRLVKKLGFAVSEAANLAEARRRIALQTPRIIILNLMLPDGSGLDLLAEVRKAKLPISVAVVTAITDRLKLHEVTALRPDAVFGKPIDLQDFRSWLRGQLKTLTANVAPPSPDAAARGDAN